MSGQLCRWVPVCHPGHPTNGRSPAVASGMADLFSLSESIRGEDYLLATFYLTMPAETDVLVKATGYAVRRQLDGRQIRRL